MEVVAIMHSSVEKARICTILRCHPPDYLLIHGNLDLRGRVMTGRWNH